MMSNNILTRNSDWYLVLLLSLVVVCWQYGEKSLVVASNDIHRAQDSLPGQKLGASYWCDEDHADYVHSLPGYVPVVPPSCWYSGYLTYDFMGRAIHTHYTLQIAEFVSSNNDDDKEFDSYSPLQKPLIYWSSYVKEAWPHVEKVYSHHY